LSLFNNNLINKNMGKTKFKQCAIYTRVSTDIQVEKEFSSCEAQEEKIRAFVQSQDNWQIFKVYLMQATAE